MGDTARTINANIQLAVNAMISAATTVAIFWTNSDKASPTRLFTVEASEDNLAPIAPLYKYEIFHVIIHLKENCEEKT